jgi:hypothetical protein
MNRRFLAIAQDPSIIHGVHHYCDEWCNRCPVTSRCLGFRCTEDFRRQRGRRGSDATFTSAEEAVTFTREICLVDGSSTEDLDAILNNPPGESGLNTDDPLASIAWDYAVRAAFLFTERTMKLIAEGPRKGGPDAAEVVLWYHLRIYMKVVRALVSRRRSVGGDRYEEDAIGCGKLTLVSIERSREALTSLRQSYGAEIDVLIASLDELERGLEARVPRARAYVRVGIDCPAA